MMWCSTRRFSAFLPRDVLILSDREVLRHVYLKFHSQSISTDFVLAQRIFWVTVLLKLSGSQNNGRTFQPSWVRDGVVVLGDIFPLWTTESSQVRCQRKRDITLEHYWRLWNSSSILTLWFWETFSQIIHMLDDRLNYSSYLSPPRSAVILVPSDVLSGYLNVLEQIDQQQLD